MRPKPWYLGAAYLLLALIIACDGGDSPQATVPPNVQEASYSATTQTLTLTLSDGTTVQADLRELATDADLQKKRESALSLVKASFDHDTRVLTLTLSDGSSVETNLGPSLSAAHLEQIASKILDALPRETEITVEDIQRILKIAVAEAVWELTIGAEATYDPKTETLILFLGDGATIQADLGSLVTDADFEAALARLQTTATPTPITVVTLPPSVTGQTPRPTPRPTARPSTTQYSAPPPMTIDQDKSYTATIQSNHGDMVIELFAKDAPITVNNFVFLAREGFYDGVIFHRIIADFMIQGGDPTGTGRGGPGYRFQDEPVTKPYVRGTLAMANAGPNTNGSQFFIMHQDYPLPPNYNVFGVLTEGFDVLDALATVATGGPQQSDPLEPQIIQTIQIAEE